MNIEDVALKLLAARIRNEGFPQDDAAFNGIVPEGIENNVISKCFALAGKFIAYSTLDEGGAGKAVEDALYNPGNPGGLAGKLRAGLEVFGLTLPYQVAETPPGPPGESPIVVIANQSLEISRLKAKESTLEALKALADSASDVPCLVARVDELEKESEERFRSIVALKSKLADAIEALEFIAFFGPGSQVNRAKVALDKIGYIGTAGAWPQMTDTEAAAPQVSGSNGPKAPPPTPADDSAKIARRVIETYVKGFMEILNSINERLPR